jgi:hypothetical protein
VAVGEAVERGVEVGAGVGHHVDPADLELVAGRVARPGACPGQVVADDRAGQPGVGDGPVGEDVAAGRRLCHVRSSRSAAAAEEIC